MSSAQLRKVDVEFPNHLIEEIRRQDPSLARRMEDPIELRRLVNNAIRVYLELRLTAKNEINIVAEINRKRYAIKLE